MLNPLEQRTWENWNTTKPDLIETLPQTKFLNSFHQKYCTIIDATALPFKRSEGDDDNDTVITLLVKIQAHLGKHQWTSNLGKRLIFWSQGHFKRTIDKNTYYSIHHLNVNHEIGHKSRTLLQWSNEINFIWYWNKDILSEQDRGWKYLNMLRPQGAGKAQTVIFKWERSSANCRAICRSIPYYMSFKCPPSTDM